MNSYLKYNEKLVNDRLKYIRMLENVERKVRTNEYRVKATKHGFDIVGKFRTKGIRGTNTITYHFDTAFVTSLRPFYKE